MKVMWVILNADKDEIVELFETDGADSKVHWDKFYKHRPGCVFCARPAPGYVERKRDWYYNYFYWHDRNMWGIGEPDGIAWSAAMTLPEPIKLLVMLEDSV